MFKIRTATAAATAAGLLLTTAAVALETASAGTADAHASSRTTRYVAHDIPGNFAMADLAEPHGQEPDIGDLLAFTQRLTRHGHTVGRVSNAAIGADHQRALFHSTGTMKLRHGTVEFAGLVPQASEFTLAVTGGTGRFAGAVGTLRFGMDGNKQILTLTLHR
jgi:hypothetical protein